MRHPALSLKAVAILPLFIPSFTLAHSWLDCTNMLDSGTCAGYPLGYPSRADIDINTKYTYLVQDRRPDAPVCQPGRQNIPGNNPYPIANVTPGQQMHLTWQPDGHLDDSRPSTIEVHWTGVPGKQLVTRAELGPATLLGTMIFGTSGNCDQPSEPNTWCHGHITVPPGTQPGTYQVIWWWKYDRNPAGEEYSTCFEMTVNGDGSAIQSREVDAKEPTQVIDTTSATAQVDTEPQQAAVVVNNVPEQAPTAIPETVTPAPAPQAAPEVAAQAQIQPQQQPTIPQQQQAAIHTEPFQLAYMTMDTPPSTANAAAPESAIISTSLGGAHPPRVDTLADLSTKADQPLNVVPNVSIIHESKKNHKQVDGFSSDDVGSLAGDAVNDHEGNDTSPLPLVKPSELINTTLSENKSARNGTTLATGANINATAPAGSNSKTNNTTAAIVPGSHPFSTDASSNKDKESSTNRNLVSQIPNVADSAATAVSFSTAAFLVSTVLVTFTWMLV
ncbi:hypothetical protein EC957_008182 [Mortierella hygrophila]|uniref:Lytic polysaccharide monooxygenase n=1 Tax=Mortierella hygrophila TaxID=979708 RepID=A0A9P6FIQ7_9FUNG|nr:hypothetical protein EC957_008182 [Mortierella hygrophila]